LLTSPRNRTFHPPKRCPSLSPLTLRGRPSGGHPLCNHTGQAGCLPVQSRKTRVEDMVHLCTKGVWPPIPLLLPSRKGMYPAALLQNATSRLRRFLLDGRLLTHIGLIPVHFLLLTVQQLPKHPAVMYIGRGYLHPSGSASSDCPRLQGPSCRNTTDCPCSLRPFRGLGPLFVFSGGGRLNDRGVEDRAVLHPNDGSRQKLVDNLENLFPPPVLFQQMPKSARCQVSSGGVSRPRARPIELRKS